MTRPRAGTAPPGAVQWRFERLLALRATVERRALERLRDALAAARRAADELVALQELHARAGSERVRGAVVRGEDLAGGARYGARLRAHAAEAMERARAADAAVVEAQERHAAARAAREALERGRERWIEARHRARDLRADRETDELRPAAAGPWA